MVSRPNSTNGLTKVEVSEISPGFNRSGGGVQVRFFNEKGAALRVFELRKVGLL